jgi:hypothetical protein
MDSCVVAPAGSAREEIFAVVAEGDLERVRLYGVKVTLKVTESNIGAEVALDLADRFTCPVRLRSREQCPVLRLEISRDLDEFDLRFLFPTPPDRNQLSIRSFRSAPRLLGFIIGSCFWDPGHRHAAGPSCRERKGRSEGFFQGFRRMWYGSIL